MARIFYVSKKTSQYTEINFFKTEKEALEYGISEWPDFDMFGDPDDEGDSYDEVDDIWWEGDAIDPRGDGLLISWEEDRVYIQIADDEEARRFLRSFDHWKRGSAIFFDSFKKGMYGILGNRTLEGKGYTWTWEKGKVNESIPTMKYIMSINELKEARQAPAKRLFKDVVKGNTSSIEGQKISKEMAQAALDWFDRSVYARKYANQVQKAGMGAVAPLIFGDYWGIKKTIGSKLKAEFKELQQVYKREMAESAINESDATPTMLLAQEIDGGEYHMAYADGERVEARSTKKTWDDGVPVLKHIARSPKKDVDLPKGKFEVVVDDKYGWYYWQHKGVWYGMDNDGEAPPFEY